MENILFERGKFGLIEILGCKSEKVRADSVCFLGDFTGNEEILSGKCESESGLRGFLFEFFRKSGQRSDIFGRFVIVRILEFKV